MLCSSPLITKHSPMPRSAGVQDNHNIVLFLRYPADINFTNYSAHAKPTQCFQSVLVETITGWVSQNQTCEEHAQYATFHPKINRNTHIYTLIIPSFFLLNLKSCSLSGHSSSLWIDCFHRQKWWKESVSLWKSRINVHINLSF